MRLVAFLLTMICSAHCLKVFRSSIALEDDGKYISGLKLIDERKVNIQDITICLRFNFQLLGSFEGRSRIITIEDWRTDPLVKLTVLDVFEGYHTCL